MTLKVYVGQTRSAALVSRLSALGWGEMTVRGELPSYRTPYAFDNGVYRDWTAGVSWEGGIPVKKGKALRKSPIYPERAWWSELQWLEENLLGGGLEGSVLYPPDFIVAPDRVAGGLASLRMSAGYAYELRCMDWDRIALAVQDGMAPADVDSVRDLFSVLFVGGTSSWKARNGQLWVDYAHEHGLLAHIGRVGTIDKVAWAIRLGADSIDSCFPLWTTPRINAFIDAVEGRAPQAQPRLFGDT